MRAPLRAIALNPFFPSSVLKFGLWFLIEVEGRKNLSSSFREGFFIWSLRINSIPKWLVPLKQNRSCCFFSLISPSNFCYFWQMEKEQLYFLNHEFQLFLFLFFEGFINRIQHALNLILCVFLEEKPRKMFSSLSNAAFLCGIWTSEN